MTRIFRNIRQRIIGQGDPWKYVKYAIGEILLVVIGILIAVQINNWNERRKDRIREQVILKQFAEEFRSNLAQLDNKIALREYIISQSAGVLDLMDRKETVALDTLLQKLSGILLAPTFDPIENTELNSDKIQLIRNDSLRNYLSNWSSGIVNLREQEDEWVQLMNNYTVPLMIDLGYSRDMNIAFYRDPRNLTYLLENSGNRTINLGMSPDTLEVTALLTNKKLEGILANAVLMNAGINWDSEAFRKRILEILRLIEREMQ